MSVRKKENICESLVSICIPTYNGDKFLQECLDSVNLQTYKNIEVIISDDNSIDKTLEICRKFKEKTKFPVYIYNHLPSGIGANWNHCIEHANGEFIKFLFQDDVLEDDSVEKMAKILKSEPDVMLVASKRKFIRSSVEMNLKISDWLDKYQNLQNQFETEESACLEYYILDKKLFKRKDFFENPRNKIGEPSAVMIRKEIFQEIGFFNLELKQILDYEYWYRILMKHKIAIINEPLISFRLHDNQETSLNENRKINDYKLYEEFQYKKLFFLVNWERRHYLLKKYNFFYKKMLSIYYKFAHP